MREDEGYNPLLSFSFGLSFTSLVAKLQSKLPVGSELFQHQPLSTLFGFVLNLGKAICCLALYSQSHSSLGRCNIRIDIMALNLGWSAILASFCFIGSHPHLFIFVYTLWILGLAQERISNLLNIIVAPWVFGNLAYSMFFHKRHIPTPAAEATPAEEGRTEAASEEDVVTLEEPQLKEQWRLDRLE